MRKIFCGVVFLLTLGVGLIGIEAHADDYTYDLVAQPVIYTPTTNQVLNNFPRTAYVSWSGVSGAVSYEIEVDCDVCSTVNWSNQYRFNSDNTNITTYALPGDNQFRVRVRTRFPGSTSDSWTMGAWSEYKYFWFDTSKPCSETDNGVDYSTQGMAFGPDESTGIVTNYFDSCGYDVGIQDQYNGLYLAEKYCSNNKVYTQWYRCSNGCAKGICVPPPDNTACTAFCRNYGAGTDGVCGGTEGDMVGSKYCLEETQCVCKPSSCSSDQDCTKTNSHHKCNNGKCIYADCNTACQEYYNYESGSCGATNGTDVGSAFCGYTYQQCKCFGLKSTGEAIVAPYGFVKIGKRGIEVPWRTSITLTSADVNSWGSGYANVSLEFKQKNYGNKISDIFLNSILFDGANVWQEHSSGLFPGNFTTEYATMNLPISNGSHKLTVNVDDANIAPIEQNNNFDVTVWFQGLGNTDSNLPACSDIRGGNVTFIVCQGYSVDHFWSGSKIKIIEHDSDVASVTMTNLNETETDLILNEPETYTVTSKPGKYLILTYLGVGQGGRALIKVDSNTTYDDATAAVCGSKTGGDGRYLMCKNNYLSHVSSGIKFSLYSFGNRYAVLKVSGAATAKSVKVNLGKTVTIKSKNGQYEVKAKFLTDGGKKGATIEFTTTKAPKPSGIINYSVGVNDYPDSKDAINSKNISGAFVVMYTVKLVGGEFIVTKYDIGKTGSGPGFGAKFDVVPGQMVDFDGYKVYRNAYMAANAKLNHSLYGVNGPPPYKNFNNGDSRLCQTNWTDTERYLRDDVNYACSLSMSVPFLDTTP